MVRIAFLLFVISLVPDSLLAKGIGYDLVYMWDRDLESVLDYQQELVDILGTEEGKHLRIVRREGKEYGVIYDLDGTALRSAKLAVQQSEVLRKAGFSECYAIENQGYNRLYNVSYGQGPNLEKLQEQYKKIYQCLGREVGKNLFIEQTGSDNYTLIYRRRGDRASTYAIAKKHATLLRKNKIQASITPENNNPIVFGESSHLDHTVVLVPSLPSPKLSPRPSSSSCPSPSSSSSKTTKKIPPAHHTMPAIAQMPAEKKTPATRSAQSSHHKFEQKVEGLIDDLRREGSLLRDESTGWMVYDLTRDEAVVQINADKVFQAASMIKPFVALAFFDKVREGKLTYGRQSRQKMEAMIQRSNNAATNWVMKTVGGPARCNTILRTKYRHIFKKTRIVEYIPPGGRTYKNSAVPSDYIRFLNALWDNKLPYGKEIRRLMSLPGRDRLYDGTPIPQGTLVYNKTGTTAHLCGDMGILVPQGQTGKRYPYALVGIIERSSRPSDYSRWMRTRGNVIRKVSTLVYQEMKGQYRLQ